MSVSKNKYELPVVKNLCPADGHTKRQEVKELIRELNRKNPGVKERMLTAVLNGNIFDWAGEIYRTFRTIDLRSTLRFSRCKTSPTGTRPPVHFMHSQAFSQLLSELVLYFVHKYLILSSCHFDKNCDRIESRKNIIQEVIS